MIMADNPQFKYYLINPFTNNFLKAEQTQNALWLVSETTLSTPLDVLPRGWDNFKIAWERNSTYFGVLRSLTNSFDFSMDGRAIIRQLFYNGIGGSVYGSEAKCILRIDIFEEDTFTYSAFYEGYLNFASIQPDNLQDEYITIGAVDSQLKQNLMAYGDTPYNISYWDSDGSGGWTTDSQFVYFKGIKLLYNQRFEIGATTANPFNCTLPPSLGSVPFIFPFQQVNYVNVNGSPIYVGNDILGNELVIGSQTFAGNVSFSSLNNFTTDSYVMKNLLSDGSDIKINVGVQFVISSLTFENPAAGQYQIVAFKAFNVNSANAFDSQHDFSELKIGNQPSFGVGDTITLHNLVYVPFGTPALEKQNNLPLFTDISYVELPPAPTFRNNMVTVFAATNSTMGPGGDIVITFTELEYTAFSKPSDPVAGIANPDAPALPASPALGYRPLQILQKLTTNLFTSLTDPYGFPDLTSLYNYHGEQGKSVYLNNPSIHDTIIPGTIDPAKNWDNVPYNTLWVSGNSIRDITGINYLNTSLNSFFKTCHNIWSVGLGIETDPITGIENIVIEPLSFFFDDTEELMNLGTNFFNLKISPITVFTGSNLKTGYQQRQANADFGIDSFTVEQDYQVPVIQGHSDIDTTVPDNPDMYQIENARAEQNNKDQSSANTDNGTYLIEIDCNSSHDVVVQVQDPNGTAVSGIAQVPLVYSDIQNTDPTAATAPYALGMLYPATAMNYGLSPARNTLRNGALLASFFDGLDSRSLAFRKQYQLLFNNAVTGGTGGFTEALYPGLSSNLQVGSGSGGLVQEATDIAIASLNSSWGSAITKNKLFRPYIIEFSTSAPINTYKLLGSNPKGYISILDKAKGYGTDIEYKGYIWKVEQQVGNQAVTQFTLVAVGNQDFIIEP